jgi:hypothetical protein
MCGHLSWCAEAKSINRRTQVPLLQHHPRRFPDDRSHRREDAWRLFLEQKILNVDKVWPKVNQEIAKGFESYPPTEKEKEEKRKERAEHPPKPQKPQFQ